MHNITLICTMHKKHGELYSKCNVDELCKIFEQIEPEVIFEEISPSRHDAYYIENSVSTIETNAIKKYKQRHIIKNIPVDKNYDMNEIKKHHVNFRYLNKVLFDNDEYCMLYENDLKMSYLYGFEYLNSVKHTNLAETLSRIEENVIGNPSDVELFDRYKIWVNNIDERENEMIQNIYNYSKENNFKNAIFTIGAGHKISILKKIADPKNESEINWKYDIY